MLQGNRSSNSSEVANPKSSCSNWLSCSTGHGRDIRASKLPGGVGQLELPCMLWHSVMLIGSLSLAQGMLLRPAQAADG